MPCITNAKDLQGLDASALRNSSSEGIRQLSEDIQELWRTELVLATQRSERHKVDSLLQEFRALLSDLAPDLIYEPAFVYEWWSNVKELYECRWWINAYTAGVYFLYDTQSQLRYVGSSCGGNLGDRIWEKSHEPYRHVVDVVLFDQQWCHFALAFETLVISRTKPDISTQFKNLSIKPLPPFDRLW